MSTSERVEELAAERGMRMPTTGTRAYMRVREWIHPLGFHHRVRVFVYDKRIDRLVDMGVRCRICKR